MSPQRAASRMLSEGTRGRSGKGKEKGSATTEISFDNARSTLLCTLSVAMHNNYSQELQEFMISSEPKPDLRDIHSRT